jgi:hypothetical protein
MTGKIYPCPFCKDVFFFTQHDLDAHMNAGIRKPAPCNAPAINEVDHKKHFEYLHKVVEMGNPYDYC